MEETRAVYADQERQQAHAPEPKSPGWRDPHGAAGESAQAPDDPVIATVAGQKLTAQDLLSSWMFRDSAGVRALVDRLVLDALVRAEASRLGMSLPADLLKQEWDALLEDFRAEVEKSQPGIDPDEFIQRRLGLDPDRYRQRMEARRAMDLLAERCVRAFTLESESAVTLMIVVPSRIEADRVEAGLAMGRDFGELARELSQDPSGEFGGQIPPIVRSQAAISRLAFATPIGQVGGPLVEEGRHIYLMVQSVNPGQPGPWSELGPLVESSLESQPIEDLEFLQWQAMVSARYEVDTTPLLRWVGEPEPRTE
ncbi:MAG: peptidylprolyl isomerase [Planctomycetes bacterium]|nr:peptidylprolyl isomerase [Planctomycetota bacterium]